MLATTRRAEIAGLVNAHRSMTNDALADELGVSVETVRRDLNQLHKEGAIWRVRGGAIRTSTSVAEEAPFPARQDMAAAQKREIALQSLSLLDDARTVFVDIGTTAAAIAHAIVRRFEGAIVTPSMRVAEILSTSPHVDVLVPGGKVRAGDMSISGPTARAFLSDINPDVAFLGTGGIDPRAGITDFELAEVDLKRVVIANSDRSYALADSNKIAVRAPYHVCQLTDVSAVLTDSGITDGDREHLESLGVVVLAGTEES